MASAAVGVASILAVLFSVYRSMDYVKKKYAAGFSEIHGYIYDDDVDALHKLLKQMIDNKSTKDEISKVTNSLSGYGWKCTPLHLAIARRSEKCFQYLLKHRERIGLNLHDLDSRGLTPLHTACEYVTSTHHPNGKIEPGMMLPFTYVEHLLHAGSNVNYAHAISGITPLMIAISAYDPNSSDTLNTKDAEAQLNLLLDVFAKHHLRLNVKNKEDGKSALHEAALKGFVLLSQNLIKKGESCDAYTKQNESPLHFAVLSRKVELVQMFLHRDPSLIHVHETAHGYTPLHLALSKYYAFNKEHQDTAAAECAVVIEELIARDNTAQHRDNERRTPLLLFASFVSHPDGYFNSSANLIFKQLLRMRGLDINAKDSRGKTALHYCCISEKTLDIAVALISLGADCSIQDTIGNYPLHYLSMISNLPNGKIDVAYRLVEMLLRAQASSVNSKNSKGDTPLQICAKSGSLTVFKELLYHRWSPNYMLKDHYGDTCLHIAVNRDANNYYSTNGNFTKAIISSITNVQTLRSLLSTPNASNRDIPMHIAAKSTSEGGKKVIGILKDYYLNDQLTSTNSLGDTPAGAAWRVKNLDSLLYLVKELGSELPFSLSSSESNNNSLLEEILSASGYWPIKVKEDLLHHVVDLHMRRPLRGYSIGSSTIEKWRNATKPKVTVTIESRAVPSQQSRTTAPPPSSSTAPSAPPFSSPNDFRPSAPPLSSNAFSTTSRATANTSTSRPSASTAPSAPSPNANAENIQYAEPVSEAELTAEEARAIPVAIPIKKPKL